MTQLHFLDPNPEGSPAVLLLHGLGATGASWTLQFPALTAAGFRPLAPDLPGFGDSPYSGHGWSPQSVAAQVADMLEEMDTNAAHVVGLSLGGVIAQQFALDFPSLTKKLVLVSTFAVLRPENMNAWFYFLRRAFSVCLLGLDAQARIVAGRVFPGPRQGALRDLLVSAIASSDPRAYRLAMRSLAFFDSRKWLGRLDLPALVVTGADDSTVSPLRQKELADALPTARQAILPNANHAVNVDQPEAFNCLLLEFLE